MDPYEKAQNTALSLLARRRHTREEVRRKLAERGFEFRIVQKVLAECERYRYIDDESAADLFLEELVRKRVGLIRIRQSMKARGFSPDLIHRMIDTHQLLNREAEIAKLAAEKKMAALIRETDDRKRREKVVRFLRSRGFRPSTISAVLNDITANNEESP